MPSSAPLRRWGARHLLAAWLAYWLLLALAVFGWPAAQLWRLTHDPSRHGSATFGFNDAVLHGTIVENGTTLWTGSAHFVTIVLWLVVPPLVLYGLWLRSRPARGAGGTPPTPALRDGAPVGAPAAPARREHGRSA